MTSFPLGEHLLAVLTVSDRTRLTILAEQHAPAGCAPAAALAVVPGAARDDVAATRSATGAPVAADRGALLDAAAAVAGAWTRPMPHGFGIQDLTSAACVLLSEDTDLLTLTPSEREERARRRSRAGSVIEQDALALAHAADFASAAARLEELATVDPDRRLGGGRNVADVCRALREKGKVSHPVHT